MWRSVSSEMSQLVPDFLGLADGGAHGLDRQVDAERAQERRGADAGGAEHGAGFYRAGAREHGAGRAGGCLDAGHHRVREQPGAKALGGVREGFGGLARLRVRVLRRVERALPASGEFRHLRREFARREHARAQPGTRAERGGVFEAGHVVVGLGRYKDAAADEFQVRLQLAAERFPHLARQRREPDFGFVPTLLADEAPGAAGLLAGDRAALDQRHGHARARQIIRAGTADDAAADDGDVGIQRKIRRTSSSCVMRSLRMASSSPTTPSRRM